MSRRQWVVLGVIAFAAVAILLAATIALQRNADTEASRARAEERIHQIETQVVETYEAEQGD